MLKHLKQLASDSLIYGVPGIVSKMIGIFLVPMYTRLFLPKDYGIINLINTTFFLLSILVVSGLDSSVGRWFYESKEEEDHKKSFGSYIWFQITAAVIVSIAIIIASPFITKTFYKEFTGKPIFIILPAISLITNILPNVLINWYRVHRRPVATVVFTITQTLTTIGLTILFVIVLHWHITGVFAALTISSAVFSIIAIIQLQGWLSFTYFNKERLRAMFQFALPFLPAALSYWLLNNTDSYFIAYFTKSTAQVGLFGVGALLASSLSLFTGAFQQAWGPFAFSIIDNHEAKKIYANVFLLYGYIIGLLAALLMLFAPEALMIFTTPPYYDSAWVAGILGYNLFLIGLTYIAIIGLSIKKVTAPYGMAMLYATIITICLNIFLIPKYGKEGSALATLIAQIIVPTYLFYRGQKIYFIPYKFTEVGIVIIGFLAVVITVRFINFDELWIQIFVKIIITILLMVMVFFLNRNSINSILVKLNTGNKVY
ncbi:MAG: oligosaccharide flippase family protein [Bacteroidota bacterium]|nr:oligosaccharide flippase family protein [Bacteroidota bacterium]